jgi:hypothetical protein
MNRIANPGADRRSDRRHALTGYARLVADPEGLESYGGIVDVSARGVRLRVRPELVVSEGLRCHVSIVVTLPNSPTDASAVRLTGDAVVVRFVSAPERGAEIALKFDQPLSMGDAFSAPPPRSVVTTR